MGELSAETLKARDVKGDIVDGASRDVAFIRKMGFPVFCRFATPKDIVGRWVAQGLGAPIAIGGVAVRSGDYVLADQDGVVVLPEPLAAEAIARTEEVSGTETAMRQALLSDMDPVEALNRFGKF